MGKACYLRTSWCIVTTRYLATTWWLGAAKFLCCAWYRAQQVNPDFWLGFHCKRLWGLWTTRVYGVGAAQTGFHQVQQGAAEPTQSWKPQEAHSDLFQQWWGWGWHHGRKDWSLDNRPFDKEADCGASEEQKLQTHLRESNDLQIDRAGGWTSKAGTMSLHGLQSEGLQEGWPFRRIKVACFTKFHTLQHLFKWEYQLFQTSLYWRQSSDKKSFRRAIVTSCVISAGHVLKGNQKNTKKNSGPSSPA